MDFTLARTSELDDAVVGAIIALKAQHWAYPEESQRRWFRENVGPDDVHAIGKLGDDVVAYLRIVPAVGEQARRRLELRLVDTVCVDARHRRTGVGAALMAVAGRAVAEAGAVGLLACADDLVAFYARCGWTELRPSLELADARTKRIVSHGTNVLAFDPAGVLGAAPLREPALIKAADRG